MKPFSRAKNRMSVAAERAVQETSTADVRVDPAKESSQEARPSHEHAYQVGMAVALGGGIAGILISGGPGGFVGALIGTIATIAVFAVKSANRRNQI